MTGIVVALLILALPYMAYAQDRCAQLRDLDREYRGTVLTEQQKVIKAKLVSWYKANCRGNERASR